ncbi:MAG: GIY-YIG nuclease family protein [Microcystaceae cyanobacterium]
MTAPTIPSLNQLEEIAYLNEKGEVQANFPNKIGVYAIFDEAHHLKFIGYSRDISLSLKQHLVRQFQSCYSLKFYTINRPSRTLLEEIKQAWILENGSLPEGNAADENQWTQPIDIKGRMSVEEQNSYHKSDDLGKIKILKQVCRRIESEIKEKLSARGLKEDLRFNPKLKEQGLLDLK